MSADCPPNLFKEFESGCGSFVKPDKDGLSYIYEVLFSHFEHADAINFTYPRLPEATFADWKKFEYWCDENNKSEKTIEVVHLFFDECSTESDNDSDDSIDTEENQNTFI
jgi:hypothetical protein